MIEIIRDKGIFKSSLLTKRIFHGFGTKLLGDGTNTQTIKHVLKNNNIQKASVIVPQQIHSTHVKVIGKSLRDHRIIQIPNTDALITMQQNTVLSVMTADCVPIIYADQEQLIIGISHGGWRGTLNNIVQNVIDNMLELGAQKEHIIAVIGPCIADCCYAICGQRLKDFEKNFKTNIVLKSENNSYLNLMKANIELLLSSGIPKKNIDYSLVCTSCDEVRFWSHHRDHTIAGQMIHFVMIQ